PRPARPCVDGMHRALECRFIDQWDRPGIDLGGNGVAHGHGEAPESQGGPADLGRAGRSRPAFLEVPPLLSTPENRTGLAQPERLDSARSRKERVEARLSVDDLTHGRPRGTAS